MSRFASLLAGWTTRHPILLALAAILLALASVAAISSKNAFDSDILNLLPSENPAVQGLKVYNSEFTQTREIAFLLTWKTPPEDLETAHDIFLTALREQPWVQRILDAPPLESRRGRESLGQILIPLLLNLPPDQFQAALAELKPEIFQSRIERLTSQMSAGSPRARFELESDPLGLAARAARPVWETVSLSDTFALTSPDGSAIIVPVITKQSGDSYEACHALMQDVRKFLSEVRPKLGPDGPEIGVTGRSAYVEEIAQSMQRDISITSVVSLGCVILLFWLGFRRLIPLIGIALLLALTALVTMAGGALIFDKLNIIAISFCSILFGIGDDFSLLLCQRYVQARAAGTNRLSAIIDSIHHAFPGIAWVAITTGIGFLALCFSGSSGFAQLGVLVAIGVGLCALLMPLFLFLFLGETPPEAAATGPANTIARYCLDFSGRIFTGSGILFALAAIIVLLPWRPLGFDLSPASLEPRNISAAQTLALMMEKFPATFEPIMVVLPKPEAGELSALDHTLASLRTEGMAELTSSPSSLVLDQARIAENRRMLHQYDLAPLAAAIRETTTSRDLSPELFQENLELLNHIKTLPENTPLQWKDFLTPESSWWFLLDRLVAPESGAAIAYLKPPKSITPAERESLAERINQAAPHALVTGWSQALASLVPWAQKELAVFGSAVTVLVLLILAFVYRNGFLWFIHVLSLVAAAAGTLATLKLLNLPINLLNVLAFPLMLGVGVDYGTHIILAGREAGDQLTNLAGVLKPIILSGLTTITGFGALILASNPALSGLGAICSIGVAWCLLSALLIVAPSSFSRLSKKT